MKNILLTSSIVVIIIIASYFAGRFSVRANSKIEEAYKSLQEDHTDILKLAVDNNNKTDMLITKLDNIEQKINIIFNIATSTAYMMDTKK